MDELVSITIKLQQIIITLQNVEIKSTRENLQHMLACQNTLDEIKSELTMLIRKNKNEEDESDDE